MQYFFNVKGYLDTQDEIEENINEIPGKKLMSAVRDGLTKAGFECDRVGAEDWGWYFYAFRQENRFLVGGQLYSDPVVQPDEFNEARVFIELENPRSLLGFLFGRKDKQGPETDSAGASLETVLRGLHGCSEIQQEELI